MVPQTGGLAINWIDHHRVLNSAYDQTRPINTVIPLAMPLKGVRLQVVWDENCHGYRTVPEMKADDDLKYFPCYSVALQFDILQTCVHTTESYAMFPV